MAALIVAEKDWIKDSLEHLFKFRSIRSGRVSRREVSSKEMSRRCFERPCDTIKGIEGVQIAREIFNIDFCGVCVCGCLSSKVMDVSKHIDGEETTEVCSVSKSSSRGNESYISTVFRSGRSQLVEDNGKEIRNREGEKELDESLLTGIIFP